MWFNYNAAASTCVAFLSSLVHISFPPSYCQPRLLSISCLHLHSFLSTVRLPFLCSRLFPLVSSLTQESEDGSFPSHSTPHDPSTISSSQALPHNRLTTPLPSSVNLSSFSSTTSAHEPTAKAAQSRSWVRWWPGLYSFFHSWLNMHFISVHGCTCISSVYMQVYAFHRCTSMGH